MRTIRGVVMLRRRSMLFAFAGISLALASWANAQSLTQGAVAFDRGDYVRAARQLGPVARLGNPRAQAMLGFMFEHGLGVPQDYGIAASWYMQAAEQGYAAAQYSLGLLYDKGFGVPQNDVLAHKWLNLAAAGAAPPQREYFLRIRDAVASKMTHSSIVEAQLLAREWTLRLRREP
jgi:TPR repeat protein